MQGCPPLVFAPRTKASPHFEPWSIMFCHTGAAYRLIYVDMLKANSTRQQSHSSRNHYIVTRTDNPTRLAGIFSRLPTKSTTNTYIL